MEKAPLPKFSRRRELARIAIEDNPAFARALVNRLWAILMGRGIVHPVDKMNSAHPPSHPELLEALAKDFAEQGYDLRHLIRRITTSRTYQLSSEPNATNEDDGINYSRALMPRLPAEVLLDAVHTSLDRPGSFKQYKEIERAVALPGIKGTFLDNNPHHDDRFLRLFGKPPRLLNSDTERLNEISLAQVFEMTSGETLSALLEMKGNRLDQLLDDGRSNEKILSTLYWTTITRPPSTRERETLLPLLADPSRETRRKALEDITWALLNSKEFIFRH